MGYVMKEFKIGDKVFDLRHGNGVVKTIEYGSYYLVNCFFKNDTYASFNSEGKSSINYITPNLYHGHDLIVEVKEPEYEWQIIYQKTPAIYGLSEFFYKKLSDFNSTGCLFEPSKRLVKRG